MTVKIPFNLVRFYGDPYDMSPQSWFTPEKMEYLTILMNKLDYRVFKSSTLYEISYPATMTDNAFIIEDESPSYSLISPVNVLDQWGTAFGSMYVPEQHLGLLELGNGSIVDFIDRFYDINRDVREKLEIELLPDLNASIITRGLFEENCDVPISLTRQVIPVIYRWGSKYYQGYFDVVKQTITRFREIDSSSLSYLLGIMKDFIDGNFHDKHDYFSSGQLVVEGYHLYKYTDYVTKEFQPLYPTQMENHEFIDVDIYDTKHNPLLRRYLNYAVSNGQNAIYELGSPNIEFTKAYNKMMMEELGYNGQYFCHPV